MNNLKVSTTLFFRQCSLCCLNSPVSRTLVRYTLLSLALLPFTALYSNSVLRRLFLDEDSTRRILLRENEERIRQSELYLQNHRLWLNSSRRAPLYLDSNSKPVDVGITVLTMARGGQMQHRVSYRTQYLTQSLSRLLYLLNDTTLTRTYSLTVCDVDEHPENFREARDLEALVPVVKRFGIQGNASLTGASVHLPEGGSVTLWEKLKHDYVFCLQQTLASDVQYALVVEDDALAHDQLLQVLEHVLGAVLEAPGAGPVTYVKLFHPQRLLGYISLEAERLPELLALSLTLGALFTLICMTVCKRHFARADGSSEIRKAWAMWAGWTIVVGVLALALGRQNLLELRRLSPQLYQVSPAPSCCTPAMLFTKDGGRDIIRYLLSVQCTASKSTDMRMEEFRQTSRARALLVQPNLFTHIGLVSTLRTTEVNPLIVQR